MDRAKYENKKRKSARDIIASHIKCQGKDTFSEEKSCSERCIKHKSHTERCIMERTHSRWPSDGFEVFSSCSDNCIRNRVHTFRCTSFRSESLLMSSKPLKDKFHAEEVDVDMNGNDSNKINEDNKSLDETEDKDFVKKEMPQDNTSNASEPSNIVNMDNIAVEKTEEDVLITFQSLSPTYNCLTCSETFKLKADLWLHCKQKYHECDIGKLTSKLAL